MKPIRVVVQGALGKMGQVIVNAVCLEPETQIVGAVELKVAKDYLTLPDGSGTVEPQVEFFLILNRLNWLREEKISYSRECSDR